MSRPCIHFKLHLPLILLSVHNLLLAQEFPVCGGVTGFSTLFSFVLLRIYVHEMPALCLGNPGGGGGGGGGRDTIALCHSIGIIERCMQNRSLFCHMVVDLCKVVGL